MQYSFKNTFPLDENIKISVAGESENGRKKVISTSQKMFPLAGIRLFFKNCFFPMVSTSRKKPLNKRILFQIDRKSVLISGNGKFVEEYLSIRQKKLVTLTGISEKSNKMITNSSKSFK